MLIIFDFFFHIKIKCDKKKIPQYFFFLVFLETKYSFTFFFYIKIN